MIPIHAILFAATAAYAGSATLKIWMVKAKSSARQSQDQITIDELRESLAKALRSCQDTEASAIQATEHASAHLQTIANLQTDHQTEVRAHLSLIKSLGTKLEAAQKDNENCAQMYRQACEAITMHIETIRVRSERISTLEAELENLKRKTEVIAGKRKKK